MTRRIEAGPVLVGLGAVVLLVSIFLDSTGLRFVLELDGATKAGGEELALIRGPDVVHRIFEITQVAERLRFVEP